MKQVIEGPADGQMDADATGIRADEGADFEQAGAQSFGLSRAAAWGGCRRKKLTRL